MAIGNACGRGKQRGMALISALMVLVILAIIAGCFAVVMNRDVRQARNSMFQVICLNSAQAGLDYAIWLHKHNMACYPLVDYPGATDAEKLNNRVDVPDSFRKNNETTEYEYATGLALGTVYNLPGAGLSSEGKSYSPASDRLGEYTNKLTGSNETKDTEYMFVNDLTFWSSSSDTSGEAENFMHDTQMCVTFQIRESITEDSGKQVLHIVSTGKIRKVPKDYSWTDEDEGWLSLFSKSGTRFSSESLADKGFDEYASRTLTVDLDFGTGNDFPNVVDATVDEDYASNRQFQMPERKKREWFR